MEKGNALPSTPQGRCGTEPRGTSLGTYTRKLSEKPYMVYIHIMELAEEIHGLVGFHWAII